MKKQARALFARLNQSRLAVGGGLAVASGAASAAIDTASITSTIADAVTAAGVIGAAALAMHYGIKAFKWLRAAG